MRKCEYLMLLKQYVIAGLTRNLLAFPSHYWGLRVILRLRSVTEPAMTVCAKHRSRRMAVAYAQVRFSP